MKSIKLISAFMMIFCMVLGILSVGSAAAYNLSLQATTDGSTQATQFTQGQDLYLNIVVDNAAGIAGCAFTLNYPEGVLTAPTTDAEGVSSGITSIFPFTFTNPDTQEITDTHRENSSEPGKIYLAGAAIDTSDGGPIDPLSNSLFTIKFTVKSNAPLGNFDLSLTQTELFNPAAGWGTDVDGDGIYDLGDGDTYDPVPVLVGAHASGTTEWSTPELTDDFFTIASTFDTPLVLSVGYVDTDSDGLTDSVETNTGIYVDANNTGTDPNNPDSDGDGLNDGDEVNTHGTDPTKADSDDDGYSDGQEITNSTNPLVADAPGGTGYDPATDTRTYQISGNISYAGTERENILVGIFEDANLISDLAGTTIASPSGDGPWAYTVSDVPARNEYYVVAFMDLDGDTQLDNGEPQGMIGPFGIASTMANKNFPIDFEDDWSGTWNLSFSEVKDDGSLKSEIVTFDMIKEADGSYSGSYTDSESIQYSMSSRFENSTFFHETTSGATESTGRGVISNNIVTGHSESATSQIPFVGAFAPPDQTNPDLTGFWSLYLTYNGSNWNDDNDNGNQDEGIGLFATSQDDTTFVGEYVDDTITHNATITTDGNKVTIDIIASDYQLKGTGTLIGNVIHGTFAAKSLDVENLGKDIGVFTAKISSCPVDRTMIASPSSGLTIGTQFTVPVLINTSQTLGSYSLQLNFDTGHLDYVQLMGTSAEFGAPLNINTQTPGQIIFNDLQTGQQPSGEIHIADISFNVKGLPSWESILDLTINTMSTADAPPSAISQESALDGVVKSSKAMLYLGEDQIIQLSPNQEFSVPVYLETRGNWALGAYSVTVTYDSSVISLESVLDGDDPFGAPTSVNDSTPGTIIFNDVQTGTEPTGSIRLATLNFAAGQQINTESLISITLNSMADTGLNPIAADMSNIKDALAKITLIWGDVDNSGTVDIIDALYVAQYDAGLITEAQVPIFAAGDCYNDGSVDIIDALCIAQYDAGLIDSPFIQP